jgi:hypothetical protein
LPTGTPDFVAPAARVLGIIVTPLEFPLLAAIYVMRDRLFDPTGEIIIVTPGSASHLANFGLMIAFQAWGGERHIQDIL